MPSTTFDRFLKQLHAEGREKADGFDPSHFDGLSQDERLEAARLLREALLAGDDTAAGGLVLLDPQIARPALEAALPKYGGDALGRLSLAEKLWKLTGDSNYQDLIIDSLRHPDETIRQRALVALRETPHDDRLMAVLQPMVLDDPDEVIRFWASIHLLYGLGLVTDFNQRPPQHRQLLIDLNDDQRDVREKALAELKSRYGPTGN
jgi:hypothetical protein